MADIYRNARVTTIAAGGDSADSGLPGVSTCVIQQECLVEISRNGYKTKAQSVSGNSTWNKRAWTYQKLLCSTRHRFFSESECFRHVQTHWTTNLRTGERATHSKM